MKGGVGKTTLAINIADCLVKRHDKKVLLIDVDPQFNCTQSMVSPEEYVQYLKDDKPTILKVFDRPKRTVAETVEGIKDVQPSAFDDIIPLSIKDNLSLLPGNLELYRVEMRPGEGTEYKLKKYINYRIEKDGFDIVLIDTPPTPSIWMTSALLASDYYIIPVKPDPLSFTGIDLLESIVNDKRENLDLKIKCIGMVLTMVEDQTILYKQALEFINSSEKWRPLKFMKEIPKRTQIAREQLNRNYILDNNDDVSKTALTGLVNEILQRI